jgi:hypothetical protein
VKEELDGRLKSLLYPICLGMDNSATKIMLKII